MRRREEAASLGCSAITLIGATTRRCGEPTQWRVPGELHSDTDLDRIHDPRLGGTVCDQGPPVGVHLAGPAPSVTRITGTCVPALRGPGSVCPA